MVRCFEDDDVTHVEGKIDPIADIETIETELMLADLDSLEKRVDALEKKSQGRQATRKPRKRSIWSNARSSLLREGKPARLVERKPEEEKLFHSLGLLTSKPVLYVCNVEEGSGRDRQRASRSKVEERAKDGGRRRGRDLGQDRGRDRRAAAGGARGLSRRRRPRRSPASTG